MNSWIEAGTIANGATWVGPVIDVENYGTFSMVVQGQGGTGLTPGVDLSLDGINWQVNAKVATGQDFSSYKIYSFTCGHDTSLPSASASEVGGAPIARYARPRVLNGGATPITDVIVGICGSR